MATSEIDIIKKRSKDLPPKQKLELIEFLTRSMRNGAQKPKQLEFGKYSSSPRMSTAEDFQIAEWPPADLDLNGN